MAGNRHRLPTIEADEDDQQEVLIHIEEARDERRGLKLAQLSDIMNVTYLGALFAKGLSNFPSNNALLMGGALMCAAQTALWCAIENDPNRAKHIFTYSILSLTALGAYLLKNNPQAGEFLLG